MRFGIAPVPGRREPGRSPFSLGVVAVVGIPRARVATLGDGPVKGGAGPSGSVCDEAVLDGVEVDVTDVGGMIVLVADGVFPEASLPDTSLATDLATGAAGSTVGDGLGDGHLHCLPAVGEVCVALGKRPEGVHVVGEHDPGVDAAGMIVLRVVTVGMGGGAMPKRIAPYGWLRRPPGGSGGRACGRGARPRRRCGDDRVSGGHRWQGWWCKPKAHCTLRGSGGAAAAQGGGEGAVV